MRDGASAPTLPRRTNSVRRVGRHRSMHRISVASDAPALVLAIPGNGNDADIEIADQVAEAAAESCPGVEIRIGYLRAGPDGDSLRDALAWTPAEGTKSTNGAQSAPRAVVVPLLAGSHLALDGELAAIIDQAAAPVMLAAHQFRASRCRRGANGQTLATLN